MISSVRQYQVLGPKKICSLRDNHSFSYVFARWIESCNLDESGCYFLKSSQDIFQEYEAEQKKKKPKKVLFLVVSTPFFRQNRAIYAVDGTTEIVNGQCPKVVEQELRQLVTALHLKISLEQMYTMPSLVVLFEQECKQSC